MDFIGRKWLIERILKTNSHYTDRKRTFYENLKHSKSSHVLLKGESGTGKTSICKKLCTEDEHHRILLNFEIDLLKNENNQVKKFITMLSQSIINNFQLTFDREPSLYEIFARIKNFDYDLNYFIIIDNLNENTIEFAKILNKIEKNLPKYIKFLITSKTSQVGLLFKYESISINYNYEENIINNTNLTNDIVDYVLHNLKSNKELLASLVFSSTINPGFSKDLMSLLNLLVIKSSCNFLYVKTFFNFLLSNKSFKFNLVQKIPSTLNGLYLYITDYLFNSFKNLVNSYVSEESFEATLHDQHVSHIFHAILNVFVHRQMRPLSKLQLYERLKSKFVFLNEPLFQSIFNMLSSVLLVNSSGVDPNKYSFIHASYHDFLCDVKYSTDVHHASHEQANEILACYYFRKLLQMNFDTKHDHAYYFTLNNFQQCMLGCSSNARALNANLTYLYEAHVIFNPEKRQFIKSQVESTLNASENQKLQRLKRFFKGFLCGLY